MRWAATALLALVGFAAALLLAGCALAGCAAPELAPIRDARPTQLQAGERMLVEASGPLFTVGAPTTVALDALGVTLPARAVAADRVVAELDDEHRAAGPTTVTVVQATQIGRAHV